MFNIFDKQSGYLINTSNQTTMHSINLLKSEANNTLEKFDVFVSNPRYMPEQRHFLTNGRESLMNVVENGYSFLILGHLSELLPDKTAVRFPTLWDLEKDTNYFRENTLITFEGFNMMASYIKDLVDKGCISWYGDLETSLTENDYDFLEDGFYYANEGNIKLQLESFSDMCICYMKNTMQQFERTELSEAQRVYYNFERKSLLICLKEHFRSSTYRMLVGNIIPDDLFQIAKMLENISFARRDIVLDMVECLSKYGILSLPN